MSMAEGAPNIGAPFLLAYVDLLKRQLPNFSFI